MKITMSRKYQPMLKVSLGEIVIMIIILAVVCLSGLGCQQDPYQSQGARADNTTIVRSVPIEQFIESVLRSEKTVGNLTWIRIDKGTGKDLAFEDIPALRDAFEKKHPEWEVTSCQLEESQSGRSHYAYIIGLWIEHKPKQ